MNDSLLNKFEPIQLEEMEQVKFMNRIDRKFWFRESDLSTLLRPLPSSYYILTINGSTKAHYATIYYDTVSDEMYLTHHNRKRNRLKIRKRTYIDSGISFLEVKFKSNKGRTIKNRMRSDENPEQFTPEEQKFIEANSPYTVDDLMIKSTNRFTRMTLVSKSMDERCTIDTDLQFRINNEHIDLENIAIAEIKTDGRMANSQLGLMLRELRIKKSGFSKYCIGRVMLEPSIKQNAFKTNLRRIKKIQQNFPL
jgi:hypothetical protein